MIMTWARIYMRMRTAAYGQSVSSSNPTLKNDQQWRQ
jgi:hypothetical protein